MKFVSNYKNYQSEFTTFINDVITSIKLLNHDKENRTIFVDIGANIGEITKLMLDAINTDTNDLVVAVDAHPNWITSFPFKDHKNIVCYNTACYSDVITKKFICIEQLTGWGFIGLPAKDSTVEFIKHNKKNVTVRMVECNTLDNMLGNIDSNIGFIKIDAETADFPILKGSKQIITNHRPVIVFEFNGVIGSRAHNYSIDEFFDFFNKNGYHLKTVIKGHNEEYIKQHFNVYDEDLHDLIAIPSEYINIL